MVMPSQTPGKESSGCDAESVLPDSASLGDDLHINSGNSVAWQTQMSLDQLKHSQNPFGSVESPSPITNELPSFDSMPTTQHTPIPNTHGHNVQILSSPIVSHPQPQQQPIPIANNNTTAARSRGRNSVSDSSLKEFGSSK